MTDRPPRPPVLNARRSDDGTQLCVWCAYCEREHWHGRHDPATGCTAYDNRQWTDFAGLQNQPLREVAP